MFSWRLEPAVDWSIKVFRSFTSKLEYQKDNCVHFHRLSIFATGKFIAVSFLRHDRFSTINTRNYASHYCTFNIVIFPLKSLLRKIWIDYLSNGVSHWIVLYRERRRYNANFWWSTLKSKNYFNSIYPERMGHLLSFLFLNPMIKLLHSCVWKRQGSQN